MQKNWNKEEIYTLVGYFKDNITFIDLEGEEYDVVSYRIILRNKSNGLVAINLRWNSIITTWIVFQLVELGDENSIR